MRVRAADTTIVSMAATESQPEYLEALEDNSEAAIRVRIEELEGEIARLKESLSESRKAKQILSLAGGDLQDEVIRFFSTLGMPAKPADGDRGEFWLVAEAVGEEWAFGEIRESATGNITRELLAHVMIDRGEAGKGDEFPALLVVNTFFQKATIEERDQAVPAEVAKRAAEDHILVVRTLDLVRLRQKESTGFAGIPEFMEKVQNGGGWYEVNASLASRLHVS